MIVGAAFDKIVTRLVEGIIMPPFGLILRRVDFTNLFFVLDRSNGIPAPLAEAKAKAIRSLRTVSSSATSSDS